MIKTPKGERTRPTQARLRQALFNSLQSTVSDAKVLDLFAGSGALGFEALSWGAAHCVFVENDRQATRLIDGTARELGVEDRIDLLSGAVESVKNELSKLGPFNIVLADPPYAGGWETKLLETLPWNELLVDEGYFCVEWGAQKSKADTLPDQVFLIGSTEPGSERPPAQLVKVREKNYGDSILTSYVKRITG